MNLIVQLKHFVRYDEYGKILPHNRVRYDYDQNMIFSYDGNILRLQGSSWSKQVKPEEQPVRERRQRGDALYRQERGHHQRVEALEGDIAHPCLREDKPGGVIGILNSVRW